MHNQQYLAKELLSSVEEFYETIKMLRDPKNGCPWDLKQNYQSLTKYLLEECYEVVDAVHSGDSKGICEELGDVLLQIFLNGQIAADNNEFWLKDIVDGINAKIVRRHPHVFGDTKAKTAAEVEELWQKVKAEEAKPKNTHASAKHFPATLRSLAIGKEAAQIGFDWSDVSGTFAAFKSEVSELEEELQKSELDKDSIVSEIGDLYFGLAQICRRLKLNPEECAHSGNQKFYNRFEKVKAFVQQNPEASLEQMQVVWVSAKDEFP